VTHLKESPKEKLSLKRQVLSRDRIHKHLLRVSAKDPWHRSTTLVLANMHPLMTSLEIHSLVNLVDHISECGFGSKLLCRDRCNALVVGVEFRKCSLDSNGLAFKENCYWRLRLLTRCLVSWYAAGLACKYRTCPRPESSFITHNMYGRSFPWQYL
jgi:hypothetical protein